MPEDDESYLRYYCSRRTAGGRSNHKFPAFELYVPSGKDGMEPDENQKKIYSILAQQVIDNCIDMRHRRLSDGSAPSQEDAVRLDDSSQLLRVSRLKRKAGEPTNRA